MREFKCDNCGHKLKAIRQTEYVDVSDKVSASVTKCSHKSLVEARRDA
jgi:hypothetical protein